MRKTGKTPWHLWVVGVAAVLFNAIGVFDYTMSKFQGAAYMAGAGMTPEQIAYTQGLPMWMNAVWAIGVWGAILGSILILLRRKLAWPVLVLSLAAFLVSLIYTYHLSDGGKIMGHQAGLVSGAIALLLAFFTWYAWAMSRRGVLR